MSVPALIPLRYAGANPALVLNADHRPLSTFPLSVWPWQTALHAVISDRVTVLVEHEAVARSQKLTVRLPSVVVLRDYVRMNRAPAFTRHNVLLRDRLCCAYCGSVFPPHELTFDHVIPRAQGGRTCWENIAAACHACNGRKADRTPDQAKMPLQWRPWKPSSDDLFRRAKPIPPEHMHKGWQDYLWHDAFPT